MAIKKIFTNKLKLLTLLMFVFLANLTLLTPSQAESSTKPLWTAGKYYGSTFYDNKFFKTGITFRISPDKKTLKDLNIAFDADFYDEVGNISKRAIRFSQSNIEPITLVKNSKTQTYYFAYLDEFGYNWNTEFKITWDRNKQSFKVILSALTDQVEGTYYKASSVIGKNIIKGKS